MSIPSYYLLKFVANLIELFLEYSRHTILKFDLSELMSNFDVLSRSNFRVESVLHLGALNVIVSSSSSDIITFNTEFRNPRKPLMGP